MYWTTDVGSVDQILSNVNRTSFCQNLDVRPYAAGGPMSSGTNDWMVPGRCVRTPVAKHGETWQSCGYKTEKIPLPRSTSSNVDTCNQKKNQSYRLQWTGNVLHEHMTMARQGQPSDNKDQLFHKTEGLDQLLRTIGLFTRSYGMASRSILNMNEVAHDRKGPNHLLWNNRQWTGQNSLDLRFILKKDQLILDPKGQNQLHRTMDQWQDHQHLSKGPS